MARALACCTHGCLAKLPWALRCSSRAAAARLEFRTRQTIDFAVGDHPRIDVVFHRDGRGRVPEVFGGVAAVAVDESGAGSSDSMKQATGSPAVADVCSTRDFAQTCEERFAPPGPRKNECPHTRRRQARRRQRGHRLIAEAAELIAPLLLIFCPEDQSPLIQQ